MNGSSYDVTTGPAGDSMSVSVNGVSYDVSFGSSGANVAPIVQKNAAPASNVSAGEDVKAPVAGTLLRFEVSNGVSVKKGQTVIVLESMKMELEVKSPCDGKISFVTQPGVQVANGQKLATIGGSSASQVASSAAQTPSKATAPVSAPAAASAPKNISSNGGTPVKAPVAGVALRHAVEEGASVSAEDTILIIESMKMELEIKAGASGKVHFLVSAGSQISSGQVVAELS